MQALSIRHGLLIWPHRNLRKFPKSLGKTRTPSAPSRIWRVTGDLLSACWRTHVGAWMSSRDFSSQFERTFELFPSTPTIAPVTLIPDRDGVGRTVRAPVRRDSASLLRIGRVSWAPGASLLPALGVPVPRGSFRINERPRVQQKERPKPSLALAQVRQCPIVASRCPGPSKTIATHASS